MEDLRAGGRGAALNFARQLPHALSGIRKPPDTYLIELAWYPGLIKRRRSLHEMSGCGERFDMRDLGRVFTHIHDQEIEISERFYLDL
jgi:hypothetical protein